MPAAAWRNRIVDHGEEAPDQLLANPRNWRVHPKHQQAALSGVLDQVGFVQSVIVNRRSGFVVDGHARVALAITRHQPTVPVVYVDLEDDEERLVLATLDPIAALAGSDSDQLAALLADLEPTDDAVASLDVALDRNVEGGHSTQKPIECMARPMRNHEPSAVYDPFLGSGTTLIAAEQLGRRCFAMEIEPAYCDVAVRRWEHVTGRKAERVGQAVEAHA